MDSLNLAGPAGDPSLSVALALAGGLVAQSLAIHLGLPGIVFLLVAGVVMGPQILGMVHPESLGPALQSLVGFAVAVILFEGSMSLHLKRLVRSGTIIRRLITEGALLTAVGGMMAAKIFLGWGWRAAILFGFLVIVTGPTVTTPLLKRIKVKRNLETILEAEGVLIDAIGAIAAVVALEVALRPSGLSFIAGLPNIFFRLGFGMAMGTLGGFLIAGIFRIPKLVPRGLENVFTLSFVFAIYHTSDFWVHESGIAAVTIAGLVVGNVPTRFQRELLDFKEQLTVMLIGMLFILLAADLKIEEMTSLGHGGFYTVIFLMLVIRPLNVFMATRGTKLGFREKLFLSWLAPRGIVAAAAASLASRSFVSADLEGGPGIQAMVFLVIFMTVVIQGLSAPLVARVLGVRRATNTGHLIFGANSLALALGRSLRRLGEDVVFLDNDPMACKDAEDNNFRVIHGNGLEDSTLLRAEIESRTACLALTSNEEANLLFGRKAREDFKIPKVYVALRRRQDRVSQAMVDKAGASILFGRARELEQWAQNLAQNKAQVETWRLAKKPRTNDSKDLAAMTLPDEVLPLIIKRGKQKFLLDKKTIFKRKDEVDFAIRLERRDEALKWFDAHGWVPATEPQSFLKLVW